MSDIQLTSTQQSAVDMVGRLLKEQSDFPRIALLTGFAGSGKCLGANTPVMLYNGTSIAVEKIRAGNKLMGPDSSPRTVISVSHGAGPLYRIDPIKGDSWVCNDEHMLTLAGSNFYLGDMRDVSLIDLLSEASGLKKGPGSATNGKPHRIDRDWKLFRTGLQFEHIDVPVDPYLVGLWIGDGTHGEAKLTTTDYEIVDFCINIAHKYGAVASYNESEITLYFLTPNLHGKHCGFSLRRFFRKQCSTSAGKRIPHAYLRNDEQSRLELLAGIIDTDGFLCNKGYEISSASDVLADQYLFLARSLGFAAYNNPCYKTIKSTGFIGFYNRITISGDTDRIPCKIARKICTEPRKQIKRHLVTGFTATPIGEGDYYGFTLDGDGRFLLGDFTVTHNTTTLKAIIGHAKNLGRKIVALAPTGKASLVVSAATGFEAKTIHRFCYTPIEDSKTGEIRFVLRRPDLVTAHEDEANLVIVDEASMLGRDLYQDLVSVCRDFKCHLLFVGDPFQLPPVPDKTRQELPFSIFSSEVPVFEQVNLTEIMRQALDNPIIRASMLIRQNKVSEALELLPRVQKDLAVDRMDEVITAGGVALCYTNKLRHWLNNAMRQKRGYGSDLVPNEPILVTRNCYDINRFNGEVLRFSGFSSLSPEVEAYDYYKQEKKLCRFGVGKLDGDPVALTPEGVRGELDTLGWKAVDYAWRSAAAKALPDSQRSVPSRRNPYVPLVQANFGYCLTTHKSQGSEFSDVFVFLERSVRLDTEEGRRWAYVAFTRSKAHVSYALP